MGRDIKRVLCLSTVSVVFGLIGSAFLYSAMKDKK